MTGWADIYGGDSSGATWGSIYGGGGTGLNGPPPSGGGGILSGIEHLVEELPGSNIASNLVTSTAHVGRDIGLGLYNVGHAAVVDIKNHPASLLAGPLAPLAAQAISFGEGGHGGQLTTKVAEPILHSYEKKYLPIIEHPLTGKSYRGIERDPFGTALDVLTIATLPWTAGGSAVIRAGNVAFDAGRAAELTRIAGLPETERAAELAKLSDVTPLQKAYVAVKASRAPVTRTVQSGEGGVAKEYSVNAAKTPWGKRLQNVTLTARESARIRDLPVVGANRLAIKSQREAMATAQLEHQTVLHQAERSYMSLKPAEREAIHVVADAPRAEVINGIEHAVPRDQWLQRRIDYLEHQMEHAPDKGTRDQLQTKLNQLGYSNPKLRDKIQEVIVNPSQNFLRASAHNRASSELTAERLVAQGMNHEAHVERLLAPARQMNGEIAPEGLAKSPTNGAATILGNDTTHGAPYVFSHVGPQIKGGGGWTAAKTNLPLGQPKTAEAAKLWSGIRLATGRYMSSPSSTTRAGLAVFRRDSVDMFHKFLDSVALESHEGSIIPKGYVRFEPTSVKLSKATRERGALLEAGTKEENARYVEDYMRQMFPKGSTGAKTYIVPAKYAKAVEQEFTRSNAVFHLMFERPMDFWRAAVLKWRPAWLVNNIVGQHLLYWITANPGSVVSYFRALKVQRGEFAAKSWLGRMLRIPEFRNTYQTQLEDAGIYGVGVGTAHGTLGEADRYLTSVRGQLSESHPRIYGTGASVKDILTAYPRAATDLNQKIADNWPRYARHQEALRKSDAALRVRAAAEAMGEPFTWMDRFLGRRGYDAKIMAEATDAEKAQFLQTVDRGLGNFNTLTPFERKYLRRIFPFYAWFKVIGAVSKDLLIDSPARVNLIYRLNQAAKQNPGLVPVGLMPTWLQGAIGLGPAKNGVQPMLSTTGLNPFNTITQLGRAASEPFKPGGSPSDTTGVLSPALAVANLFQGIDPFTGGTYKGAGANESPLVRAIIGEIASLPQIQLAQSYGYLGGRSTPKTYAPETHHIGPLNANDTLLAYLGFPRKNVILAKAHDYAKKGY